MPPSHHISVFYPAHLTHYYWDKSPFGWQAIKNCPSSSQITFALSWVHSFILIFTFAALASSVHQSGIKFVPTLRGCINLRPVYKGVFTCSTIDVTPICCLLRCSSIATFTKKNVLCYLSWRARSSSFTLFPLLWKRCLDPARHFHFLDV